MKILLTGLKLTKKTSEEEKRSKNERAILKKARKLFRKGNFREAARCCTVAIVSD